MSTHDTFFLVLAHSATGNKPQKVAVGPCPCSREASNRARHAIQGKAAEQSDDKQVSVEDDPSMIRQDTRGYG